MRSLSLLLLAACVAAPALRADEFLDYAEAARRAKASGKDIVVFLDGSNWVPASEKLNAALSSPELRRPLGDRVLWARFDSPEETPEATEAKKAGAKKTGAVEPDLAPWNLPAILVVGPDGRSVAVAEGIAPDRVGGVIGAIPGILESRAKRDALWTQADAASGVKKAELLGRGLDLMPPELARARKDIRDKLKVADPKDESGYTFKYDFDQSGASSLHEGKIMTLIGDKKYDEALATVDTLLKNRVISPAQRQIILAGRFQVLRAQEKLPEAIAVLRQIIGIDARNDMGLAAADYLKDHTEPVRLAGRTWEGWQNNPVWLPFVADVSDVVKTPGAYEVEFRHRSGHTRFRAVAFRSGSTDLAIEKNPSESRKVRLVLEKAPKPGEKIEVWAESRGTGWFDGAGDIVVTKVN